MENRIIKNELKHCLEKAIFQLKTTEKKEDDLENYQNIFYSILNHLLNKGLKDDFIIILKKLRKNFFVQTELDEYIYKLFI